MKNNKIISLKNFFETYFSNRTKVYLIIGVIIAAIIIIFGKVNTTEKDTNQTNDISNFKLVKEEQTTWEETNIIPGVSDYEKEKEKISGDYEGREIYKNYTVYKYVDLENYYMVKELGVNREGKIDYVLLTVDPYGKKDSSYYYNLYNLKEPDIAKDISKLRNQRAEVYLKEGVMLYIGKIEDAVSTVMFFEPMNGDEFDNFWGNENLVEKYEPHDYGEAM